MVRFLGGALLALAAVACSGEDGKGINGGDHCPEQTLYRYVFLDAGVGGSSGHWAIVKPGDGKPVRFSATELAELQKNQNEATRVGATTDLARCLTPGGNAVSLDADGGP